MFYYNQPETYAVYQLSTRLQGLLPSQNPPPSPYPTPTPGIPPNPTPTPGPPSWDILNGLLVVTCLTGSFFGVINNLPLVLSIIAMVHRNSWNGTMSFRTGGTLLFGIIISNTLVIAYIVIPDGEVWCCITPWMYSIAMPCILDFLIATPKWNVELDSSSDSSYRPKSFIIPFILYDLALCLGWALSSPVFPSLPIDLGYFLKCTSFFHVEQAAFLASMVIPHACLLTASLVRGPRAIESPNGTWTKLSPTGLFWVHFLCGGLNVLVC
jgi:hypothetical protein